MTARESFNRALADLLERDMRPPCAGSTAWTSDEADERAAAAVRCLPCPLLDACADLADEADERFGVWAGVDRSPLPKPTRRPRKGKAA